MADRVIHMTSGTVHEQIEVIERGRVRYLRFGAGGGWQGAMHLAGARRPVFPYQRAFAAVAESRSMQSFLALGVGSGTALSVVRALHPDCEMFGLELDEQVIRIAIEYFGAPSHRDVSYWVGDGVAFLCHTDVTVDTLFVDAYLSNRIYSPCLDPAFAKVVAAATTADGVAVMNFITSFPLRGRVLEWIRAAQSWFESIALLPVGPALPFAEQNVLGVFAKTRDYPLIWRASLKSSSFLQPWERLWWPRRMRQW
ncbi:hypothetical protein GCM10025857_38270 [Alicyclobacillus contaminans]|nr:hypothetical protein GCM10025857_38270 [Alicyclobacillus contaminans]